MTKTSKYDLNSKAEKKMMIKQNTQFSLSHLKKICRSQNDEKFKDFLNILIKVENGSQMVKVKECVKKLINSSDKVTVLDSQRMKGKIESEAAEVAKKIVTKNKI